MISQFRRSSWHWTPIACTFVLILGLVGLTDAVGDSTAVPPHSQDSVVAAVSKADAKTITPSLVKTDIGKLYLNASLRTKDLEGETKNIQGVIEVHPENGEWRVVINRGHSPRVSPNGETLAFSDNDKLWNCDIKEALGPGILADVNGGISWMPDGKHLVVTSSTGQAEKEIDDKGWRTETWQIRSDGAAKIPLPIPATDFVEDISPDGAWFVTSSDRHQPFGSGYQLYLMRPDGTEQRRLTKSGLNVYARFSPDSHQILYVFQNRDGNKLKIINVDGTDERTILSETGVANSVDHATFSPDGNRVAVVRYDWQMDEKGKRVLSASEEGNYRIEIVDNDGSNGRVLELKDAKAIWLGGSMDWR